MTGITTKDLHELLQYFSKRTYRAKDADSTSQAIMQRCVLLADLDYTHSIIDNSGGELSAHYPSRLIILECEKSHNQNAGDTPPPLQRATETIYESNYDTNKLKDVMKNARIARCRSRFPLPVILYKGRHVCRSATLSGGPEIYGRSGFEYFFAAGSETGAELQEEEEQQQQQEEDPKSGDAAISDWQLFDKVRKQDIKLLKTLNVGTIVDFMVEKKKVKFGVNVTSSEKVDKERRYSEFSIVSLPYPGCEFFKEFRENDYHAQGLLFDWSQSHVDAGIRVPEDHVSSQLGIKWQQYQVWDLVHLTQNYLKLILSYLADSSSSGMLFHCISGWDRTPLFVSLLRLSLWADGAIHTSLDAHQMLYFTIAYDWMLFGHDLADRLAKGEEIFYFCFYFLRHIVDDEYSVNKQRLSNPAPRQSSLVRNDGDSLQIGNAMFEAEPAVRLSSVSSNLSLNSCCSNASRDSQDNNPPSVFHCTSTDSVDGHDDAHSNGNVPWQFNSSPNKDSGSSNNSSHGGGSRSPLPTTTNRTSPVPVPVPRRVRQRNESSSSSTGSWQMISCTGSLRGSTTTNAPALSDGMPGSSDSSVNSVAGHASQDSSTTLVDGQDSNSYPPMRQQRLDSLRQIFSSGYTQTIGLKMKDTETTGITQLLGNFAGKVGMLTAQRSGPS